MINNHDKLLPFYDHWCPLVRFYWHQVLKGIVRQIEANSQELILDFGCGKQRLKSLLQNHNIIGYDIIREFSDVSDYTVLRPHTIICSHVLEHMEMSQLLNTLDNFIRMKPKLLITAQPTDNWLARISNLIGRPGYLSRDLRPIDHKLRINEIHKLLTQYFCLISQENIFTLTIMSKWRPKGQSLE